MNQKNFSQANQENNPLVGGNLFKFKKHKQSLKKNSDALFTNFINMDPSKVVQSYEGSSRKIPSQPFKVLDAPHLNDDFYLNLVDWSASNVLAVALGSAVYIWNACTSSVGMLCDVGESDGITAVSWS